MIDNPGRAEAQFALLRDCSHMDYSVVERLRATVGVSLEWAEQALDVLIRLDDDMQSLDAMVKQQIQSLRFPDSLPSGDTENRLPGLEEIGHQTEQSVQRLRNGVRDIMMSMQLQDVIGQAVERAASAIEKRATAIGRVVEEADCSPLPTNEIAEIHRVYRTDDDLHRATRLDGDEYKTAA